MVVFWVEIIHFTQSHMYCMFMNIIVIFKEFSSNFRNVQEIIKFEIVQVLQSL